MTVASLDQVRAWINELRNSVTKHDGMEHPFGYDPDLDNFDQPGGWTCYVCGNDYAAVDEDHRFRYEGKDICASCKITIE
jgi:hypothetical protein